MVNTVIETLILDLLDWLASAERTYEEVMDAWRTSCPKVPVWVGGILPNRRPARNSSKISCWKRGNAC